MGGGGAVGWGWGGVVAILPHSVVANKPSSFWPTAVIHKVCNKDFTKKRRCTPACILLHEKTKKCFDLA